MLPLITAEVWERITLKTILAAKTIWRFALQQWEWILLESGVDLVSFIVFCFCMVQA